MAHMSDINLLTVNNRSPKMIKRIKQPLSTHKDQGVKNIKVEKILSGLRHVHHTDPWPVLIRHSAMLVR